MRTLRGLMVGGCVLAMVSGGLNAGELDPPSGVVSPTMKDLDDVEARTVVRNDFDTLTPIVIDQPGSYYLGEDILGLVGEHGIEIRSSDVTLDLNGFAIRGNTEVGSLNGIHVTPDGGGNARRNITVRNGTVRDFGNNGIAAFETENSRFIDLCLHANGLSGNGGTGLQAGRGCQVRDCVSSDNRAAGQPFTGAGFDVSLGTMLVSCVAYRNEGDGIGAGVGSTVDGCSAYDNDGDGFSSGNGTVFADCSSRFNAGRGFYGPQRCVFRGCAASDNGSHGIESINESVVTNCVASDNGGDGILATDSLVRGNVARSNTGTNINALGGTTVVENH